MNHILSMLLGLSLVNSGHVVAETISNTSNLAVQSANACILDSRGLYRSMTPAGFVMPVIPLEAALTAESKCPQVSDVEKLKAAYTEYDQKMLICGHKLNVYLNALPKQSLSNIRATILPNTSGLLEHALRVQKKTDELLEGVLPCISDQNTSIGSCKELFGKIQEAQTQKGIDFHNSPSGQYLWNQLQASLWNSLHRTIGTSADFLFDREQRAELYRKREEAHKERSLIMADQDTELPAHSMHLVSDQLNAVRGFLYLCVAQ